MSTPAAEIIYQLLTDLALVEESGTWPAYISFLPDQPDQAVAVLDQSGTADGRISTGERIEHPGFQVIVRDDIYATGWAKANAIALALDNVLRVSVAVESDTSYIVQSISRLSPIQSLGVNPKDEQRRYYFTINAVLTARAE